VNGDARLLEIVLTNLLGNAWKYTVHTPQPLIRVFAQVDALVPTICVADNGAGFDMKHAAKLFVPFQRLHREDEFPGIGIGLATVQRIIRRHGGTIQATGAPGAGATFRFSLPKFDQQIST
jgi:signal transduction histidine kinase